jgi:hypothetical protein
LKRRNSCVNVECLRDEYAQRVGILQDYLRANTPDLILKSAPDSRVNSERLPNTNPVIASSSGTGGASLSDAVLNDDIQEQKSKAIIATSKEVATLQPVVRETELNQVASGKSATVHPELSSSLLDKAREFLLLLLIPVGLILAYKIAGWIYKCPKCEKAFADKEVGRELIDRRQEFETVIRNDEHRDRDGRLIKTVSREEQVQVQKSKYRISHECKYCNHEWTTENVE